MLTPRERFIETLSFGTPDRIPFSPGGPRESTLRAWRTQGLPQGVHWYDRLVEKLGIDRPSTRPHVPLGVDFRLIPQFEEKVLEHRDGHVIVQDWKGNVCEISDEFDVTYLRTAKDFVTRRWLRCPVETRDDWERMKLRYDLDAPGRWPDDFEDRCRAAADRDWVLAVSMSGPFWQMREWCGFEGLCLMMIEQPDLVEDMLRRICARVVPDCVHISEDMAYKVKAMISPAMTRRFCQPSWTRWTRLLREAGCPIVDMDSDGFVGELIPLWIESGINVCDPIEVAAGNDIAEFRDRHGKQIAYRMGIDKRAMAKGGRTIRQELKRIEPVLADGGYIPGCDHGVPPDISWPAFVDYADLLARMTGWL